MHFDGSENKKPYPFSFDNRGSSTIGATITFQNFQRSIFTYHQHYKVREERRKKVMAKKKEFWWGFTTTKNIKTAGTNILALGSRPAKFKSGKTGRVYQWTRAGQQTKWIKENPWKPRNKKKK